MLTNPVLERLRRDEVALGLAVRIVRSGEIVRIARAADHDFVYLDGQHATHDVETVTAIAQTALACGVAPVIRARSVTDPDVPRLLDVGVTGVVFPDVENVAMARAAVDATRFAPRGRRSYGGTYPHFDFAPLPVPEAIAALDAATLVVCMIESPAAVDAVEEIVAVDGVDVVHVGMNDLLIAMGHPGELDHPDLVAAVARTVAAARRQGKHAGVGGTRDVARLRRAIGEGVRFLTTEADVGLLRSGAARLAAELRGDAHHG